MRTGLWITLSLLVVAGGGLTVGAAAPPLDPSIPGHRAAKTVRDCRDICPEMVLITPGSFQMGAPDEEHILRTDENPVHEVHIDYVFAAGKYPVTRGEWRQYVAATGHSSSSSTCIAGKDWLHLGFPQDDRHPVVCVSWDEAQDYVRWLSHKTGHLYRLLSEAEYEYINRAGTSTRFFWGDKWDPRRANGGERSQGSAFGTSPVGAFQPNNFGLYDTTGNVASWTQDCWEADYNGAPTDGSARTTGDCSKRVFRGGGFASSSDMLRPAFRFRGDSTKGLAVVGLRVARTR